MSVAYLRADVEMLEDILRFNDMGVEIVDIIYDKEKRMVNFILEGNELPGPNDDGSLRRMRVTYYNDPANGVWMKGEITCAE